MGNEFQNAGNSAFHVIHAGTIEIHVARLGGFAKPVAIGKSAAGTAAIQMWCSVFSIVGVTTSRGRDSGDRDLAKEVTVFSVLIPSNTTSLRRWSSSLFLCGPGRWVIWKGRGSEEGTVRGGAPGGHGP